MRIAVLRAARQVSLRQLTRRAAALAMRKPEPKQPKGRRKCALSVAANSVAGCATKRRRGKKTNPKPRRRPRSRYAHGSPRLPPAARAFAARVPGLAGTQRAGLRIRPFRHFEWQWSQRRFEQ